MHKPTSDEILQALDDLDEGKPISADMRVAVNQFLKAEVEAHLAHQVNHEAARELERELSGKASFEKWAIQMFGASMPKQELDRLTRLWVLHRPGKS